MCSSHSLYLALGSWNTVAQTLAYSGSQYRTLSSSSLRYRRVALERELKISKHRADGKELQNPQSLDSCSPTSRHSLQTDKTFIQLVQSYTGSYPPKCGGTNCTSVNILLNSSDGRREMGRNVFRRFLRVTMASSCFRISSSISSMVLSCLCSPLLDVYSAKGL